MDKRQRRRFSTGRHDSHSRHGFDLAALNRLHESSMVRFCLIAIGLRPIGERFVERFGAAAVADDEGGLARVGMRRAIGTSSCPGIKAHLLSHQEFHRHAALHIFHLTDVERPVVDRGPPQQQIG